MGRLQRGVEGGVRELHTPRQIEKNWIILKNLTNMDDVTFLQHIKFKRQERDLKTVMDNKRTCVKIVK